MAQALKTLPQGNAGTTLSTYYTVPSNIVSCILKEIILCNTTSTDDVDITIYIVPNGGTAGSTNMIFNQMKFLGTETKAIGLSTFLNADSSIQVLSNTDNAICITASVVENS